MATVRIPPVLRPKTGGQAEVLNDEGKLCALARMTIAVRPRPEGG